VTQDRDTPGTAPGEAPKQLRLASAAGRWVLVGAVLGSGIAFLDATIVNVALNRIGEQLDASLGGLSWIVNGYTLTLASLILLGGSLGDRFGRRRVFLVGVVWFGVASVLCGIAPNTPTLIAARALQGVGGALLTPGSLAILQASFAPQDRAAAIGAWSGLGGVATAIGPFLGGYLVGAADWGWRLAFLINVPFAAVVVWVALRHMPESWDPQAPRKIDVLGAVLTAAGLAGLTYGLIQAGEQGIGDPLVLAALVIGVVAFAAFVLVERRSPNPMVPLDIFANPQFTWTNVVTFVIYGAFGAALFLLSIYLQSVVGYAPLAAGLASLPVTVVMLLLSARAGRLAQRIGPRLPMTAGPLLVAAGLALMVRIGEGSSYVTDILPAVLVFSLGLSLTVAPLTATVLAAAEQRHAGVASGVNNAVARAGSLLAVAVIPVVAGLSGDAYTDVARFTAGFRTAVLVSAALCAVGGVIAWLTIRNDVLAADAPADAEGAEPAVPDRHCSVAAPPLRTPVRGQER
jgi:EmrB/QacA subfamily drug resistance transporter